MALAKTLESDGATAVLNRVISEQPFQVAGTDTGVNKVLVRPGSTSMRPPIMQNLLHRVKADQVAFGIED